MGVGFAGRASLIELPGLQSFRGPAFFSQVTEEGTSALETTASWRFRRGAWKTEPGQFGGQSCSSDSGGVWRCGR